MDRELEDFLIINQDKIWVNNEGGIVYDSMFEREFEKRGGDLDILHTAIEDCVYTYTEEYEQIEWGCAIKTYKEIIENETQV